MFHPYNNANLFPQSVKTHIFYLQVENLEILNKKQ